MAGVVPEKERRPSVPGEFPLDHGSIFFKMHRADADAEFIRCRMGVDKDKLVNHALKTWGLEEPGVLLRVCGTTPHTKAGVLEHHADFVVTTNSGFGPIALQLLRNMSAICANRSAELGEWAALVLQASL